MLRWSWSKSRWIGWSLWHKRLVLAWVLSRVDLILRVGYVGIPIGEIRIVPIVYVPTVEASLILYIEDLFNLIVFTFLSLCSRSFTNKVFC